MRTIASILDSIICKFFTWIPEKLYLKIRYRLKMGEGLDLENPKGFNQKLQWLKLYNRKPELTQLVDKIAVKKIVASKIGAEYVVPTLGIWERFDDIDFDGLPDKFVLKTAHAGGGKGVVICTDKRSLDIKKARASIESAMRSDLYRKVKEWPYKNVPKRIMAEQLLEDKNVKEGEAIPDYKFYCFDGYVDCVMVCVGRESGTTQYYFFDRNWQLKKMNEWSKNAPEGFSFPKPKHLDKMFEIASDLSKGHPHVRIDLYSCEDKIYFGEETFYSCGGYDKDILPETDIYFGNLTDLNLVKTNI